MLECSREQSWGTYYKENMEGLGLPVPSGWFVTNKSVEADIAYILLTLKTLGKSATIAELVYATTGLERMMVLGSLGTAYYLGAMIGSSVVASGRYAACGTSLSDVALDLHNNGIHLPAWMHQHLQQHPEVFGKNGSSSRQAYGVKARQ